MEGERELFLSLGEEFQVEHITKAGATLCVSMVSLQRASHCPLCAQASQQIHSHYQRVVTDVPCGSQQVRLLLAVRKFFCRTPTCPRKIFTERFPTFVEPSARMTTRLRETLQAVGLATGGEGGSRLASKLGMQAAPTTLLRSLQSPSLPPAKRVRVLGIDDWAYKRGQTYGTILVDLERHRVIDLLPDRTSETVKEWLQTHPEIEVISRDRGSSYADAARQGAPQAMQVADRFHLIKNVREKLKEFLDRKRTCLPWEEEKSSAAVAPSLQISPSRADAEISYEGSKPRRRTSPHKQFSTQTISPHEVAPQTVNERQRALNREKRYALYEEVKALRKQGLSHYAIAGTLGLSRPTVRRFLEAEQFPERRASSRTSNKSIVAPYLPFLRERWLAGCHNGRQLFREAKARGYAGSSAQLERVTTEWRKHLPASVPVDKGALASPPAPPPKRQRLSPQHASWFFVMAKEQLPLQQQQQLQAMCQASEEIAHAYELSQSFVHILKEQKAQELATWLRQARGCQVTELRSLAKGMQQDYAAIFAACSQPWSQGQVEGQINRLKLLKRQMYGRARFDLLRVRVLQAS